MARIWSLGYEVNSTSNGYEFDVVSSPAPIINNTKARSGSYCSEISSLTSTTPKFHRTGGPGYTNFYLRLYVNFDAFPSAENVFFSAGNNDDPTVSRGIYMSIDNVGLLKLYDEDGQITGTTSLLAGRYYCIEIRFNNTGAGATDILEARVDQGTPFATSSTRNIAATISRFFFGGNLNKEAQTVGTWYFDDLALNDTSGSYQNSWPGDGKIIVIRPDSPGTGNNWVGIGGGAFPSNSGWTAIDENPPDDATTYMKSSTINDFSTSNLGTSGLSSADNINVVSVSTRHSNDVANLSTFAAVLYSPSGPSYKTSSTSKTINSTGWYTNYTVESPYYEIPMLTTYVHPSNVRWTSVNLDAIEAGVEMKSDSGANFIQVTAVWVTVDYSPPNPRILSSFMPYLAGF